MFCVFFIFFLSSFPLVLVLLASFHIFKFPPNRIFLTHCQCQLCCIPYRPDLFFSKIHSDWLQGSVHIITLFPLFKVVLKAEGFLPYLNIFSALKWINLLSVALPSLRLKLTWAQSRSNTVPICCSSFLSLHSQYRGAAVEAIGSCCQSNSVWGVYRCRQSSLGSSLHVCPIAME